MRIIGGRYRGKKLMAPLDHKTRPTTDRIKENLFNILENGLKVSFPTLQVLDLFSGTGALGIEALSRGAQRVTFVDSHKPALQILRKNLSHLVGATHIQDMNVLHMLQERPQAPYGLIFMDPPYGDTKAEEALHLILQNQWIAPEGVLVLESDKSTPAPHTENRWEILNYRSYGRTTLWFLSPL